jgi:hypothetical protein
MIRLKREYFVIRKEAQAKGLCLYIDHKTFKHGHTLGLRYTSNGACAECFRSPRVRFLQQRANPKRRGIRFGFSYKSWLTAWGDNFMLRGRGRNKLCMSRPNDKGGYRPNRVAIISFCENASDGQLRRWRKRSRRLVAPANQ